MLLAAADPKVSETPITAPASSDLSPSSAVRSSFACPSNSSSALSCQLTDVMLSVKFS